MSILHPYVIEAYVARDGSEVCLSLNPPKAFCARDGSVKETKLELEFSRYETYEEKMRERYTASRVCWHTPRRRGST